MPSQPSLTNLPNPQGPRPKKSHDRSPSIWTSQKQNVLIDPIITHQLIKYFCGSFAFMSFFYKKK
jgi:hypothetical protein